MWDDIVNWFILGETSDKISDNLHEATLIATIILTGGGSMGPAAKGAERQVRKQWKSLEGGTPMDEADASCQIRRRS